MKVSSSDSKHPKEKDSFKMELPKPPDDPELKNIVDKLANFVARNGPEFEQMTKQKQKDNPKFSFLFGGEYFNYYQYRVTTEQAIANKQKQQLSQQQQTLVQQAITPQSLPTVPWQQPGQPPGQQPMNQPPPQGIPQQPPPQGLPQQPPPQGLPQQPPPQGLPQQPPPQGLPQQPPPQGLPQQPPPQGLPQQPPPQGLPQQPPQGLPPQQSLQGLSQQPLQQQLQNLQQQVAQHQVMMDQQIKQSEQNLAAQYQSLIQQQQIHIDEALIKVRDEKLDQMCRECDVKMEDLHSIVQPIIDSCTKDAILNGKSWIFQHCAATEKHCDLIANYLQKRLVQPNYMANRIISPDAAFELRLHLIYLINDLLHHCVRKNASELKTSLEKVVVPIFCTASTGIDEDKKQKLIKLLTLWDQNKYFEPSTIEQLKNPAAALSTYQANLITENAAVVGQITNETQQKYGALQKQHQDFSSHLSNQLQQLQQQLQSVQAQMQAGPPPVDTLPPASVAVLPPNLPPASVAVLPPNLPPSTQIITSAPQQMIIPSEGQQLAPPPQVVDAPVIQQPVLNQGMPPMSSGPQVVHNEPQPLMQLNVTPTLSVAQQSLNAGPDNPQFGQPPMSFSGPPPGFGPGPGPGGPPPPGFGGPGQFSLPDFSKPPPGFPPAGPPPFPGPPPDIDLTPSVPYYELPAGLMAPLVKLEEHEYRPLDPKDIRLPPPMPPSERLLAAVEAFYSVPTHERPRDSEGWEKLGLYEFFKAKQSAKKQRDLERELRGRQHSRSRSRSPSRSPSRSRSRSPPRERFRDRQDDRRRSRSQSISRSPSPPRNRRRYNSRRSRSRSRSRSESPLPYQPSSRSPSPQRRRRISRSPTPPLGVNLSDPGSMMTPGIMDSRLGMDNKGHQLLKKMGWGGKGLGASEQGIVDPISGGDVRDRQDMFKGIGMDLKDPFEQFRKSKSHGFIQRMKARDEERTKVQKSREKEKDAE